MKINTKTSLLLKAVACFLLISTFIAISIFQVNGLQQTASVEGRVVDEDNQGLSGVRIEAYLSAGNYLYSITYTDEDGYFSFKSLMIDKYNLHFSKTGYVTRIISIDTSSQWPDLGDIILYKALRLSSSVLSLIAIPGSKLSLPFTISNNGEDSEVVKFYVSKPEGWSTRILYQTREVTTLNLLAGTSLDLQLEVSIPLASIGDNGLTLVAAWKMNSTVHFAIRVKPSEEPMISCQFPGKSVVPDETARFQVSLKNPFGVEMRFMIYFDSIPSNWEALIKSVGGEAVTEIDLDGGDSVDFIVEVTPPSTVSPGKYGIVVKVESSDGSVASLLPLSITVREPEEEEEEIEVAATFREVTVEAGKVVKFPFTIINSGETDRTLLLSIEEYPANWKVAFKESEEDIEVSGIYLPAGKSANLVVEVTPPSTVSLGSYAIPVRVKSGDGTVNIKLELKANIVGSYELSLEASTLLTSVTVGGQTTFTARIKNVGQTPVTSVRVNVNAPEDWEASVTPVQVESLEPLESYTFTITVKTPEDIVAGDYLLTIKGLSDQVESDGVSVRVTVTTPTSWGLIGVGIAVVMVVALLFIFKKFKRR